MKERKKKHKYFFFVFKYKRWWIKQNDKSQDLNWCIKSPFEMVGPTIALLARGCDFVFFLFRTRQNLAQGFTRQF